MGSDRARLSYDPRQHYRSVVMQQGRVTLEADWNESQAIFAEGLRRETLDIIGPAGTPDNGYEVVVTNTAPATPFDFTVSKGTMYVGGERLTLHEDVQYSAQSDWLDHSDDPDWMMPDAKNPANDEYVYLLVREQEVSAVEDRALREVALGGPDTAARTRLIQHIVRLGTSATDCAGGLADAEAYWAKQGLKFDPATMRLMPQAMLQVSFGQLPNPDPCEPEATGGYLGADNQLIRVQIVDQNTLVWGFDNASFLYRVGIDATRTILTLDSQPVDAFHQPQANQAVEALRSAAKLADGEYIAASTGVIETLTASYNQSNKQLQLPTALPLSFADASQTPQVYLRVWQQEQSFTPGTPVELGSTGVYVTLTTSGGMPFHPGDYWMIAVRPSTPAQVYPALLLNGKEPDGPRRWACPLASIEWSDGILQRNEDCRVEFCNLIEACSEGGGGCCTVAVKPADAPNLQSILDQTAQSHGGNAVTICLAAGIYQLTEPIILGGQHSRFTIEACDSGGVTFRVASGAEEKFLHGMIVINASSELKLRGIRFAIPPVPFGKSKGIFAGLEPALLKALGIDVTRWMVSIGIRLLSASNITITDCVFAFSSEIEKTKLNVFAAAILGAGEGAGTTVIERDSILWSGKLLANSAEPLRILVGLLYAPAVAITLAGVSTGGVNVTSVSETAVGSAAASSFARSNLSAEEIVPALLRVASTASRFVIPPVLQTAIIRDNTFVGLSAAALIYANNGADIGDLTIEDNHVTGCYAGFWIVGQGRLASFNLSQASQSSDPISLIASTIADAYPLPSYFKPSKPVEVKKTTLISSKQPPNAAGELLGLYFLRLLLSSLEASAMPAVAGAALSMLMSNNQIESIATTADGTTLSAEGVLIATNLLQQKRDAGAINSKVVCDANNVRNSSKFATVAAYASTDSALTFTGNLIFNDPPGNTKKTIGASLLVTDEPGSTAGAPPAIAVAGNIFRAPPTLPPRNLPPPLNTWNVFNTEV